ncbi:MAG: geranylgeranyl reductase family protein [Bacillota bacterium]
MRYRSDHLYDLAVVGAGPAGSLTAALAAAAGLSVVLLEKCKLPRQKTCGGLISARALALLPAEMPLPEEVDFIRAVRVHSRGRTFTYRETASAALGAVVRRAQFDLQMARYAAACGAELIEEAPLTGLQHAAQAANGAVRAAPPYRLTLGGSGRERELLAHCVVGADGAQGRCAGLAGLRGKNRPGPAGWALAAVTQVEAPGPESDTACFYPLPLRGGLGWRFPGRGWVNCGAGGLVKPARLKQELHRLFPDLSRSQPAAAWPLPFTGPLRTAARDNLLLVGDAAGLVDPFSGEGIYNALQSARLAAAALRIAHRENKPAGPIYSRLFREHFRGGFFSSLTGAVLLHALSAAAPAALPPRIAAIMRNTHWYKRDLREQITAQEPAMAPDNTEL